MQQSNTWRSMVAWSLVGVLMVGPWATPGWAKKPKEEKPKPIEVLRIIHGARDLEMLFQGEFSVE